MLYLTLSLHLYMHALLHALYMHAQFAPVHACSTCTCMLYLTLSLRMHALPVRISGEITEKESVQIVCSM